MLPFKINPALGLPLYRQIMNNIKEMIASGGLKPGAQLPSIRELASALRINPSSAVKAYNELKHAGIIVLDQGRGTFVAEHPEVVLQSAQELLLQDLRALLQRAAARGFSQAQVVDMLQQITTRPKEGDQ